MKVSKHFVVFAAIGCLTLIAFTGCSKPGDTGAIDQNQIESARLPEDRSDAEPLLQGEDRILGVWRNLDGDVVQVYRSQKTGGLVFTGFPYSFDDLPLFFESIRLEKDPQSQDVFSAKFKLTGSHAGAGLVSVSYLINERTEFLRLGVGIQDGSWTHYTMESYYRVSYAAGLSLWAAVAQKHAKEWFKGSTDGWSCFAGDEDGDDPKAQYSAFERAVMKRNYSCVGRLMSMKPTPEARREMLDKFGVKRFFKEYPDGDVYFELQLYKLFTADEVTAYFDEVLFDVVNRKSLQVFDSRVEPGAREGDRVSVNANAFSKELLSYMLNDQPRIVDKKKAMEELMLVLSQSYASKLADVLKKQNGGKLPYTDPGLLISYVIRAEFDRTISTRDLIAAIDRLLENGWSVTDRYSDGSGSLVEHLVKSARPELVKHMAGKGVIFTTQDLIDGRAYLADLRADYAKATDFDLKNEIYFKIQGTKEVLKEIRAL